MIDFNIVNMAEYNQKKEICILGIGQSCASTLLQMKNRFREKGIWDVKLFYLSENESSMPDLYTICEDCIYASSKDVKKHFGSRYYDYIVVESETDKLANLEQFFEDIGDMVKDDGQIITTAIEDSYPTIVKTLMMKHFYNTKRIKDYYFAFVKAQ